MENDGTCLKQHDAISAKRFQTSAHGMVPVSSLSLCVTLLELERITFGRVEIGKNLAMSLQMIWVVPNASFDVRRPVPLVTQKMKNKEPSMAKIAMLK